VLQLCHEALPPLVIEWTHVDGRRTFRLSENATKIVERAGGDTTPVAIRDEIYDDFSALRGAAFEEEVPSLLLVEPRLFAYFGDVVFEHG
jgi:hypothetical protein